MTRRLATFLRDFLDDPGLMAAYWRCRFLGATVCRVRGHDVDDVADLLGTCRRCLADLPTARSRAMWRALADEAGEQ